MTDLKINFQVAESALNNLHEAIHIQNPTDLERDGTIQRFKYSYKICWKK